MLLVGWAGCAEGRLALASASRQLLGPAVPAGIGLAFPGCITLTIPARALALLAPRVPRGYCSRVGSGVACPDGMGRGPAQEAAVGTREQRGEAGHSMGAC